MALYLFSNPNDPSEIVEVSQAINDPHEYHQNGVKWDRVWQNPQLNTKGSKIDPFNKEKFVDKTGKMKGTYGDLLDYSEEMSSIRKEKMGSDPVQDAHFDNYHKKVGKKHLLDKRGKSIDNDLMSVEL